jgi:membrane associated rhomboid family serine protease
MAAICPKCLGDLNPIEHQGVTIDVCASCRGIWLDPGEMAQLRGADEDLPDLQTSTYICPRCEGGFETFEFAPGTNLFIDRCQDCRGIWLDDGELQRIQAISRPRKRLMAVTQANEADNRLRESLLSAGAGSSLQPRTPARSRTGVYLFQLLTGLPVEVDAPRQRFPYATLGLIVACVLAFLAQPEGSAGNGPFALFGFFETWGFVPARFLHFQDLFTLATLFTSMFLHGGLLHLLGNMYFLWVFGDNVEDRLNRGTYLVFYLVCGLAASLLHAFLTPEPGIPTVGASGAISGIMGAYLVLYPGRQMYQVFWFIQFKVSVIFYLLFWLGIQVLFASVEIGGVAWFAHIGGFATGAAGIWLLKKAGRLRPEVGRQAMA